MLIDFIDKLKKEKFNIDEINQEYLIIFNDVELIKIKEEESCIKILFQRDDICSLEEENKNTLDSIYSFLLKCKEVILEKEKNEGNDKDGEENSITTPVYSVYGESKFVVREIPLPVGFLTLMEYLDRGLIEIPKNQRNYVWTKEQVENLACSLICGYPIPPLYGYRNDKNQIVILDGQQRLISMYLYYKDKYLKSTSKMPINLKDILNKENNEKEDLLKQLSKKFGIKDQEYYLKEISKTKEKYEIKEITYSKLDNEIKRILDFRSINIIEIMVVNEKNSEIAKEKVYFEIFGNLNQGGTQLKNQELRNGIYAGNFYDMLHDINDTNETWRKVFGDKHRHSRDVEFLLRFATIQYMFSLTNGEVDLDYYYNKVKNENKNTVNKYEGSYPALLNDFSVISLGFSKDKIEKIRKDIETFLEKLKDVDKTYNLLLESLYFASLYISGNYTIENSFIKEISESKEYKDIIESGSASRKKVKTRLEYVFKKMKERYGEVNGY